MIAAIPSTFIAGQVYTDANLGYTPAPGTATFGNQLWSDADGDGIRDLGEPGLGGVTVEIYLDDGDGLFNPATRHSERALRSPPRTAPISSPGSPPPAPRTISFTSTIPKAP